MSENEYLESARTMLKILTGKKYIWFTSRCNESIRVSLQVLADIGRHHALLQDEGGWMTYEKYIKQAGLEPVRLITHDGLIYPKELDRFDTDGVLLLNSLAGYVAMHDMEDISLHCAKNDILLINDVSGSIGTSAAKHGDIIIGSFGKAKPVNLGMGGFFATDDKDLFDKAKELFGKEFDLDFNILGTKLKNLETRQAFLQSRVKLIKEDLKDLSLVHPEDSQALNVIVRFENDEEKEKILSYCDKNNLEHTLCPREIRIQDDAISIEVKRLEN